MIEADKCDRYGSMSFLSLICGYLFLPELKNRSLEEVDKMFESKLPLRKFGEYHSLSDVGAIITKLGRGDSQDVRVDKSGSAVEESSGRRV